MAEWITPDQQGLVLFAGDFAGQFQQQAVAHGDVRDDHLLGLGLVQENLVDQQGRIEGFRLGEGQAVAFRQLLGRILLATIHQLVELGRVDDRQVGRFGGGADFPGGEAGVAPDGHKRVDLLQRHALQRGQGVGNVLPQQVGRTLRRLLAGGEHLLQPDRAQPQALRGGDLAVLQQRQQRAPSAHVGDQGLPLVDSQGVAHRLTHRRDRQPALLRGVDHLDVQPGGHEHAVEERIAVGGLADGGGGHRADLLDLVQIEQLAVVAQHLHGGAHALAAQPAAAERVLPQADRPLEPLQHFDPAVGKDLGDDHPQGVRPHVDGGHRLGGHGARRFGLSGLHEDLLFPSGAGGQERSAGCVPDPVRSIDRRPRSGLPGAGGSSRWRAVG